MGRHRLQEAPAELQSGPAADQDAFGLEEVDQVGEPGAEVLGGLLEDGQRRGVGFRDAPRRVRTGVRGREHRGERGLLVRALGWLPARLRPALEQRLRARVRLQAAPRAAAAAAPAHPYRQVPPFHGPARSHVVPDHTGADTGAEEHHRRAPRAPAGAEPHLRLAQRLGPVVDVVRHRLGQDPGLAQQPLQRNGVPADRLAVHDRAFPGTPGDDARHADPDAEQPLRRDARLVQHLGDALAQMRHDDADVVAVHAARPLRLQRSLDPGQLGEGEVEEFDPHPGLADVDADHVGAPRADAQQRAGAAAGGVDASGLLHQSFGDQFGDHVADRAGTQPGGRPQREPAERPVEIQPLQYRGAVLPPQVTHRTPVAHLHPRPLVPKSLPQLTCGRALDATFT